MNAHLLPEKHVRTSESLLGIGAVVLSSLKEEAKTLDTVCKLVFEHDMFFRRLHGSITIENVVLAIDFLYAIGAVKLTEEGLITNATP